MASQEAHCCESARCPPMGRTGLTCPRVTVVPERFVTSTPSWSSRGGAVPSTLPRSGRSRSRRTLRCPERGRKPRSPRPGPASPTARERRARPMERHYRLSSPPAGRPRKPAVAECVPSDQPDDQPGSAGTAAPRDGRQWGQEATGGAGPIQGPQRPAVVLCDVSSPAPSFPRHHGSVQQHANSGRPARVITVDRLAARIEEARPRAGGRSNPLGETDPRARSVDLRQCRGQRIEHSRSERRPQVHDGEVQPHLA